MSGVETSVKISRDTTVYDSRNSSVSKFLMSLKIFHESQIFSWVSNFFHESQKFFMSLKMFFMSLTKPANGPYVSHWYTASFYPYFEIVDIHIVDSAFFDTV